MGENKHIEELDAFAKKYIKEIPSEAPSVNFTANLMQKITELETVKTTITYKPLISKKVWFLLVAAVLAIIFIPLSSSDESIISLPEMNLSFMEKLNFSGLFENVSISSNLMYLAIGFSALIFVQIFYLKGHFEKQING